MADRSNEWLPPTGPHPVGLVEFDVMDHRRAAMYADPPSSSRRIKVMAWYPAASAQGRRRRYFENVEVLDDFAKMVSLEPFVSARHRETETASHLDAPVADGRWPVLVFNHGGAGYAQQNTLLMEHLASHGYVVLAAFHPHESWTHQLVDGTVVTQNPRMMSEMMQLATMVTPDYLKIYLGGCSLPERLGIARTEVKKLRPIWLGATAHDRMRDNLFVVDCVSDGAVPEIAQALASAADTTQLGYFGMSYGGHIAALSCLNDPRAKAGLNLDGGFFTAEVLGREIGVPFFALTEDTSMMATPPGVDAKPLAADGPSMLDVAYERVDGTAPEARVHRVSLRGMAHLSFTDLPWMVRDQEGLQGLVGAHEPKTAIAVQRRFVHDFFDTYVKGEAREFPQAAAREFGEIAVIHDRKALLAREQG